jgi:phenylacetate-coenzyme A ligase PaaK-like adenylate-forming protein
MHPWVANRVIFPLHEWFKGKPTHAWLRELERTEWLSAEALAELQFRRLRQHLEFAYREVPYFTRLLDEHGLPPSRIQSLEDFSRLPCLTRETLRQRFDDLQPRTRIRHSQRLSTGGSTGVPVTVLVCPERAAFTDAVRLRAHRWFGVDMGAREVVLWGSSIELTRQDRLRSLRDRLLNSRLLSAFDLGEAALARYVEVLRRERPEKLYGYASALALLARYLRSRGWVRASDWPRAVFATAEPLFDFQRALIRSVLGCPVAVEYGARDAGLIGTECPAGGLHIPAEGMVVEIVPTDGDSTGAGEVVVTNLQSWAMPIIRYRTGDIATPDRGPCPCGRALPRLGRVDGRRTDFLVTPDGRVMHALAVIYVLRDAPGIGEFQVVQDRLDTIRVTVVPTGTFSKTEGERIVRQLHQVVGEDMSVELETVESIVRPPSGKHRYVISRVAEARLERATNLEKAER